MHIGVDGSRCDSAKATGVERYSRELLPPLVKELHGRGHRVTVYVRRPLTLDLALARIRVLGVRRLWTHAALGPAAAGDRVDRLFVPSHVLPLLGPARSVVVLHDLCVEQVPDGYSMWERWYVRLTMASALRSAHVITHSGVTAAGFRQFFRAVRATIHVVAPAVPHVGSVPHDLPWPRPYLLYLGRLEVRKNVELLLDVFHALTHARPEIPHRLVLIGPDGAGAQAIHRARARTPSGERVLHVGYVSPELRDAALRAAHGVILPSRCEGTSFVLLEARAARIPFAASDLPVLREAGGPSGVYVTEPSSREAWGRALEQLIDRPIPPDPPPARTWADVAREIANVLEER